MRASFHRADWRSSGEVILTQSVRPEIWEYARQLLGEWCSRHLAEGPGAEPRLADAAHLELLHIVAGGLAGLEAQLSAAAQAQIRSVRAETMRAATDEAAAQAQGLAEAGQHDEARGAQRVSHALRRRFSDAASDEPRPSSPIVVVPR